MTRLVHEFLTNARGTILVFSAFSLVAILGRIAVPFDIGPIASTYAQLQSFADHVAVASACELHGGPDAINRAASAADTMINGSQTFGQGAHPLGGSSDFSIAFYATLPAEDTTQLGTPITDRAKAQYRVCHGDSAQCRADLRARATPDAGVACTHAYCAGDCGRWLHAKCLQHRHDVVLFLCAAPSCKIKDFNIGMLNLCLCSLSLKLSNLSVALGAELPRRGSTARLLPPTGTLAVFRRYGPLLEHSGPLAAKNLVDAINRAKRVVNFRSWQAEFNVVHLLEEYGDDLRFVWGRPVIVARDL